MNLRKCVKLAVAFSVFIAICGPQTINGTENCPDVIPAKRPTRIVLDETMKLVFEEVKTPFKYGIVIRGEDHNPVDCPSVFRYGQTWFMVYVCMNKVGYETHLARSNDLLRWEKLGKLLYFRRTGWDAWQGDGGIALHDHTWGGSGELHQFDGKYWMSYIGGAKQGYEPDPLAIGIAWTKTPDKAVEWNRISENPVLSRDQSDARQFERLTLYKSNVVYDKEASLGYPFVMFYNGKVKNGYEKIGMAVSKDMIHWIRYGQQPVIANGEDKERGISGDPQIVKIGDVWVMFYFGAFWKPKAFDTFACSYDLVNWTKWTGQHLVEPSEAWDAKYAHKPWVIKYNGVVYHFYCAVGDQGRVIALATSKKLAPAFDITTKKAEDRVVTETKDGTAIFTMTSPSGIGGATIRGNWPEKVVLRLRLGGLESLAISNGAVTLAASIPSHIGLGQRLSVTEHDQTNPVGKDSPYWTEIRAFDGAGKPASSLPDKDGYFEITVPKAMLESRPNDLTLGWIDFYRR